MNCKICSSKKIDIIGEIYDYEYNLDEKARYLKCLKCKTIFRNKIFPIKFFKKGNYYEVASITKT